MSTALDPDPRLARRRVTVGAVLVILLGGLGVGVLVTALTPRGTTEVVTAPSAPAGAQPRVLAPDVYVHVLGEVAHPGLFSLRDGARVIDAIAAAGGLTEDADPGGVNLARLLSDGEQLYVPAQGEAPPPNASAPGTVGGRVNLNTADAATLDTLPGVGPAIAARILAWREEHGRFAAIDDLLAVSGIGASILDGLRDLVTV